MVAQSVEDWTVKQRVLGSRPSLDKGWQATTVNDLKQ